MPRPEGLAKICLENLAGPALGERIAELDRLRHLEARQLTADVRLQLRIGDGRTILEHDQRYTAPGLGFIVGNTGLSVVTIDNATGETLSVDKLAGHQDGTPFPALCVGLE